MSRTPQTTISSPRAIEAGESRLIRKRAATGLGERILLALSRSPDEPDYGAAVDDWTLANALDLLRAQFPDLDERIAGKRVLDFGCGNGWQSVALVRHGAGYVLGIDINPRQLAASHALAQVEGLGSDQLEFSSTVPSEQIGTFDVVISQNSMEHFADPRGVLRQMREMLSPSGVILVTFGPPWYAPFGSHMHFFTKVPWVTLLFPEATVMRVRSRYRSDGATRYEQVESGLNRMSVARFERLTQECGLRMLTRRYQCVRGLDLLGRIPLMRELFINNVSCILAPARCLSGG